MGQIYKIKHVLGGHKIFLKRAQFRYQLLLNLGILVFMFSGSARDQLSPIAQAIYDSCIAQTPLNVSYAVSNGVQVLSTSDSNSFYLQWFPSGVVPNETPLIVTLHGSKGNAFNEFKSWHTSAFAHDCGIIAIQYNKFTNIYDYFNGYFQDDTIYTYIDSALSAVSYPSNKALLHGFSLGSARTYAMNYMDLLSGKNYFCTTISNAGKIDLTYPLYNDMDTISQVFAGKHWNLFCGPPESPYVGGPCDGLDFTETWLQSKGAIVDIYIQDPLLGHNGFQLVSSESYKDTMLNKYLECFNGTASIEESKMEYSEWLLFPNPNEGKFIVKSTIPFERMKSKIVDPLGKILGHQFTRTDEGWEITFLPANDGIYFLQLETDRGVQVRRFFVNF